MRKDIKDLSTQSNNQYTQSQNLLEYIKTTNRQNGDIWVQIHRIMELTEEVIQTLDNQILNKFIKKTHDLKVGVGGLPYNNIGSPCELLFMSKC